MTPRSPIMHFGDRGRYHLSSEAARALQLIRVVDVARNARIGDGPLAHRVRVGLENTAVAAVSGQPRQLRKEAPPEENGMAAAEAALDLIDVLEDQLTVYRETSEVSGINRRAAATPVMVGSGLPAMGL